MPKIEFEPNHIQEIMSNSRRRGKASGSAGAADVALAFHRGVHTGYLEGYKDAKKKKPPRYKEEM